MANSNDNNGQFTLTFAASTENNTEKTNLDTTATITYTANVTSERNLEDTAEIWARNTSSVAYDSRTGAAMVAATLQLGENVYLRFTTYDPTLTIDDLENLQKSYDTRFTHVEFSTSSTFSGQAENVWDISAFKTAYGGNFITNWDSLSVNVETFYYYYNLDEVTIAGNTASISEYKHSVNGFTSADKSLSLASVNLYNQQINIQHLRQRKLSKKQ
jgi:hypothetical protein